MLLTSCSVRYRRQLWDETVNWTYLSYPKSNRTGIKSLKLKDIWRYLRWSKQPKERPAGMPHSTWQWMLVGDFVDNFNKYQA